MGPGRTFLSRSVASHDLLHAGNWSRTEVGSVYDVPGLQAGRVLSPGVSGRLGRSPWGVTMGPDAERGTVPGERGSVEIGMVKPLIFKNTIH